MNSYKCPKCSKTVQLSNQYEHFKRHNNDLTFPSSTICIYCNSRQLKISFEEHIKTSHIEKQIASVATSNPLTVNCKHCNSEIATNQAVHHMKLIHRLPDTCELECPYCSNTISLKDFTLHLLKHIPQSNKVKKTKANATKSKQKSKKQKKFGFAGSFTLDDSKKLNKELGFKKHQKSKIIYTPMRD